VKSYAHLFQRALGADPDRLHFAAHSHHPWPDASHAAQGQAWDDAARLLDSKWDLILGEIYPSVKSRVARRLGTSDPDTLAFAPSSHELLVRLVSSIEKDVVRVLTTDAEFHGARRQLSRWAEAGKVQLECVSAEPFDTFQERFVAAASKGGHDLVTFSHVLFDSGFVVPDLSAIVAAVPDEATEILIDGYHAFNALVLDLSAIESRAFYSAGGYKYAMGGEGCCFLHCPPGRAPRPVFTGWFAGFGSLESEDFSGATAYSEDGWRFLGSTYDPVGLYRLDASLGILDSEGLGPAEIHAHVSALQQELLAGLPESGAPIALENLIPGRSSVERGHFLTFRLSEAAAIQQRLQAIGVLTDARRDRLRFGMGIYHGPADVQALLGKLRELGLTGRGALRE
jgi:kynureninase